MECLVTKYFRIIRTYLRYIKKGVQFGLLFFVVCFLQNIVSHNRKVMKTYQYIFAVLVIVFLSSFGGITNIVKGSVKTPIVSVITTDSLPSISDSIIDKEEPEEEVELVSDDTQASYYHDKFTGRKTASGQVFDNSKYTAAHKTLPFGTKVKVTNLKNKRFVILTITDRGPFVKGRGIDISKKAFHDLTDNHARGVLDVKIEKILEGDE